MHKKGRSGRIQAEDLNQESVKTTLCGRADMGSLDKGALLYQRVLSALIEEDESEEFYLQSESKNMSLNYASDDSHCGSCNLIDIEPRDRDRMESEVESKVNFQTQKNCFLDRLSCDKSVISNAIRNPSMPSSLHSNEQWPVDDDFSHSDAGHASEICSNDPGALQMRELNMPGFSSSDGQYQLMCLDERLLLELQSIGLCPETLVNILLYTLMFSFSSDSISCSSILFIFLYASYAFMQPDVAEREVIIQNIMELKEGLHQQVVCLRVSFSLSSCS